MINCAHEIKPALEIKYNKVFIKNTEMYFIYDVVRYKTSNLNSILQHIYKYKYNHFISTKTKETKRKTEKTKHVPVTNYLLIHLSSYF